MTAGEPAPTRWDATWVTVDLGESRLVSGLVFELGDGPWNESPRVAVSRDGQTFEEVEARASLADATVSLYRDPRRGRGHVLFDPRDARILRIERAFPIRPGSLEVVPGAGGSPR